MLIAWMHEIVRETSIIGEDDKPRRLLIEASYRKDPLWHRDDIHDTLLTILPRETGGDDSSWLIEDIVHEIFLILYHRIIDFYDICFWIDHLSDMCDYIIHADESFFYIFLSLTT
jgi:hypothetical protein